LLLKHNKKHQRPFKFKSTDLDATASWRWQSWLAGWRRLAPLSPSYRRRLVGLVNDVNAATYHHLDRHSNDE
jgi:hypothetical protein